jgi:hypothetical protein
VPGNMAMDELLYFPSVIIHINMSGFGGIH